MTWPTKKLGEVINPQYGYTATAKDKGNFRFVRITDINEGGELKSTGKKYVSASLKKIKNYILTKGDLLVARTGSIGRMLYFDSDESAIFASYLIRLKPDISQISPKYLWLFSHTPSYWGQVGLSASGAVQPQFNANRIKTIKIPLPPLKTQQQIIDRLDAIKKAQELNDKQISLADELFQSLLERELSLKNKNWKIKNLGDLVNVKGGKRVPKGKRLLESKTSHPYIRVIDFKDFSVDTRDIKYIDQKTHEIIKNYTVEGNDVYVSIAGTTGLVGLIPEELSGANLTENAVKLILKDENVDRKFLTFFLSSNFGQNQLKRNTYAPGVPKLAIYRLENTKIPLPPLETQRQIVAKLQTVQDYKKKLSEQKQKLQELFNSALDKTMKGELVN